MTGEKDSPKRELKQTIKKHGLAEAHGAERIMSHQIFSYINKIFKCWILLITSLTSGKKDINIVERHDA